MKSKALLIGSLITNAFLAGGFTMAVISLQRLKAFKIEEYLREMADCLPPKNEAAEPPPAPYPELNEKE